MKRYQFYTGLVLLALSTGGCRQTQSSDGIITLDIVKEYPEKEIQVQDIMEVTYVALETDRDYITQAEIHSVGERYILVMNWDPDGNIYIFDAKTGKPFRKINRMGQGAEEYLYLQQVLLDEESEELFAFCAQSSKIQVYNLEGEYKRTVSYPATKGMIIDFVNFDKDHFICYELPSIKKEGKRRDEKPYHLIFSKKDGKVVDHVNIPFDIIESPAVKGDGQVRVHFPKTILPYKNNWLMTEPSTDTIFHYSVENKTLQPFLVKQKTENPYYFLQLHYVSDQYCFLEAVEKTFNFQKNEGFFKTSLVYDRHEEQMFELQLVNADHPSQPMSFPTAKRIHSNMPLAIRLEAFELIEASEKGELRGRLQEIASTLDEESNPVIMLMKNKN